MNVFDIIGPVMIGPSSSHTAGAVRLGYAARKILGGPPRRAVIQLSGSFAQTCRGHGTDRALVAGILGFQPDNILDFIFHPLWLGAGQIYFINHRKYIQVMVQGKIYIGQRLSLNPLCGIHHQNSAIAGRQAPAHFVIEIHMPGSID